MLTTALTAARRRMGTEPLIASWGPHFQIQWNLHVNTSDKSCMVRKSRETEAETLTHTSNTYR